MDTSEQYIKMCKRAEEIQGQWKPAEADFMFNTAVGETTFIRVNRTTDRRRRHHSIPYNKDRFFWLPRQDQLQEMVGVQDARELLLSFHRFTHPADGMSIRQEDFEDVKARTKYRSLFTSMEQLWLAFVMKEKYNKVWNGGDWT